MRAFSSLVLSLLLSQSALGVVTYDQSTPIFFLEQNGETEIVKTGATVSVVHGDRFRIRKLENGATVNVLGFRGGRDDAGQWIKSHKDLMSKHAENKEKQIYKVISERKKKELGHFFVQIVKPELKYLVVEINGQEKIIHPEKTLLVSENDKFKIKEVVTNIANDTAKTRYELRPIMGPHGVKDTDFFKMHFLRSDREFAALTLIINK